VLYERGNFKLPEENNFYGSSGCTALSLLAKAFKEEGWVVRKSGWEEIEVRNLSAEIGFTRDAQGVLLNGCVAIESGVVETIDRILYGIGSPYRFEVYDEEKNLIKEKYWP
jgi:hypothetical protein